MPKRMPRRQAEHRPGKGFAAAPATRASAEFVRSRTNNHHCGSELKACHPIEQLGKPGRTKLLLGMPFVEIRTSHRIIDRSAALQVPKIGRNRKASSTAKILQVPAPVTHGCDADVFAAGPAGSGSDSHGAACNKRPFSPALKAKNAFDRLGLEHNPG